MGQRIHPRLLEEVQKLAEIEAMREKISSLLQQQINAEYNKDHMLYMALVMPYDCAVEKQKTIIASIRANLQPTKGKRVVITGGNKTKKGMTGTIIWSDGGGVIVRTAEGEHFVPTTCVEVII